MNDIFDFDPTGHFDLFDWYWQDNSTYPQDVIRDGFKETAAAIVKAANEQHHPLASELDTASVERDLREDITLHLNLYNCSFDKEQCEQLYEQLAK